jgi:threonine/homoserine/homoserine lactone efflux protein
MLSLVWQAAGFGLTAGALPGPLISYLVTTTLTQGWRRALPLVTSPLISDIPIILLTALVLQAVPPQFITLIRIAGGLFLLWIAYGAWKKYRAGNAFTTPEQSKTQSYWRSIVMNWLSPAPYIMWSTVLGPLLISGLQQSIWMGLLFLGTFYGVFIGILLVWIAAFERMRHLDARIVNRVYLGVLIILVYFGLRLIAEGLGILGG